MVIAFLGCWLLLPWSLIQDLFLNLWRLWRSTLRWWFRLIFVLHLCSSFSVAANLLVAKPLSFIELQILLLLLFFLKPLLYAHLVLRLSLPFLLLKLSLERLSLSLLDYPLSCFDLPLFCFYQSLVILCTLLLFCSSLFVQYSLSPLLFSLGFSSSFLPFFLHFGLLLF